MAIHTENVVYRTRIAPSCLANVAEILDLLAALATLSLRVSKPSLRYLFAWFAHFQRDQ